MDVNELDTVVLECDLPDCGLAKGDLGAVVQVYSANILDVEFVTACGQTRALVTLEASQVRALGPQDMPSVRQVTVA